MPSKTAAAVTCPLEFIDRRFEYGGPRQNQAGLVRQFGFATKQATINAETHRRIAE